MKIGFTGTRSGMTLHQRAALLNLLGWRAQLIWERNGAERCEFHHGDCVGADAEAHDIAVELTYHPVIHPPSNPTKRAWKIATLIHPELPYLKRNEQIVLDTDELIAAPGEFKERQFRSGTWSTIRFAQKIGRKVTIIFPDGSLREQS